MRDIFTAELTALGDDLVALSRLVEAAIASAGRALLTGDLALAEEVIADDHTINAIERDLDERCVMLIAQQQPVARDLRIVISALRMSASLERMGDLARHLAEVTRLRYPGKAIPEHLTPMFAQMIDGASRIAAAVSDVLVSHDVAAAEHIATDDDLLDRLHLESFDAVADPANPLTPEQVVDVTLCARYLERFGDHAVSIGSRVVYLVTGEFGDFDA